MRIHYFIVYTLMLFIGFSCSTEKFEPVNLIEDQEGVLIDLKWSTGSSSQQSVSDINLDLYLKKGEVN